MEHILRSTRERAESLQRSAIAESTGAPVALSPSVSDSPGSISRSRSSRPPMQLSDTESSCRHSERTAASVPVTVEDMFRRFRHRADDLTARETRVAKERHVAQSQYATAMQMREALQTEIEGVEQRKEAVEVRENALEDRELLLYYMELWYQKKEIALKQKQASKKAGGFFRLQVRPGAASRSSETLTQSDRAYDGDVDTLTQSSNDAGSAAANRADQHAAGPSFVFRGNIVGSSAHPRHYGSMSLDSFFNLHYRDGADPLWIEQINLFFILSSTAYEDPARGRTNTSFHRDQKQSLSATAAVFTPRAARAAEHDARVSSLQHDPVPSSSMPSSTPAPAGMADDADETTAEAEGASLYEDAQENATTEEDQSGTSHVRARSIRRVSGSRSLSASYRGKVKEKSQD
jgi:hypothetical protein